MKKKTREFHDNESENISGESELLCRQWNNYSVFPGYSRAALINFFVPDAALIRGRRLIEGGAYSSKYGTLKIHITDELLVATTSFEIVLKSLARFSTQFRVKESFKLSLAI